MTPDVTHERHFLDLRLQIIHGFVKCFATLFQRSDDAVVLDVVPSCNRIIRIVYIGFTLALSRSLIGGNGSRDGALLAVQGLLVGAGVVLGIPGDGGQLCLHGCDSLRDISILGQCDDVSAVGIHAVQCCVH